MPSAFLLKKSQDRVLRWWQNAWINEQDKSIFMVQSIMALPGLSSNTSSFEEVFEAMFLQVNGVKDKLLVSEWQ
ncbi:hypothetical protein [Shewanella gaetbuli]